MFHKQSSQCGHLLVILIILIASHIIRTAPVTTHHTVNRTSPITSHSQVDSKMHSRRSNNAPIAYNKPIPNSIAIHRQNRLVMLKDVVTIDLNSPCHKDYIRYTINFGRRNHISSLSRESNMILPPEEHFEVSKSVFAMDLVKDIIEKTNHIQGQIIDMIRSHLISECRLLEVPIMMEIPKHTSESNLVKTFTEIYRSLVNQTAHMSYIYEMQQELTSGKRVCNQHGVPISSSSNQTQAPDDETVKARAHARLVADDFLMVGSNMTSLMCDTGLALKLFDIPVDTNALVDSVLSHAFEANMSCARMAVVDCLLMQKSVTMFAEIGEFLRNHSNLLLNRLKHSHD